MQQEHTLHKTLLIIFTRYPAPGTTKTRLIPSLGKNGAAELHRRMTEHITEHCTSFAKRNNTSLQMHHEGGSKKAMQQWLGSHIFKTQVKGDLGIRMSSAFQEAFNNGYCKVVIIGSDCPDLTPNILQSAYQKLDHADLVLGPAHDGGYYLIGLKEPRPFLFSKIPWGTNLVLDKTLRIAEHYQLTISLLEQLNDIDRPEDLTHFSCYSNP